MNSELTVQLNREDERKLKTMAIAEYRSAQQQAAYLIKIGLESRSAPKGLENTTIENEQGHDA